MQKPSLCFLAFIIVFSGVISLAQNAIAAGFYIQEQSVSGLGSAFAGQVSTPRDASIMFFNPAGMARLDGAQINVGVNFIYPDVSLTDTGTTLNPGFVFAAGSGPVGTESGGNPGSLAAVPNAYFATPITSDRRLWAGIGLAAPFGLGSEYKAGYFARFDSTESELKTIDILPSLSYAPNDRVSIGGTLIMEYADATLKRVAPTVVAAGPPAVVAELESALKGDDWSFGYNLGVMYEPWDGTTLGANYRSHIRHKLEGRIFLEGAIDSPGYAKLELPDIATIGITHAFNERWTGLLQGSWFAFLTDV